MKENKQQPMGEAKSTCAPKKGRGLTKLFFLLCAVGFAFSAAGSAVVGTFANTYLNNASEYNDKCEFFETKGFDLNVKGPSQEQIEGFKVQEGITNCTPYLEIDLNIKVHAKSDQSTFLVFDNVIDIKHSENTEKRLIEIKDGQTNPVFVDYKFAKNNNLKLNDVITVFVGGNPKECSISRIYKTDFLFTKGVIITTVDVIPSTIKSGVYLSTNNLPTLKTSLANYKPMGTLLPKTDYQTDEQYQQYLDAFYARDYSSTHLLDYVEDEANNRNVFYPKCESSKIAYIVSASVFGVLCLAVSLLGLILVMKNKKDYLSKYIRDNGPKRPLVGYSLFNGVMVLTALSGAIISLVLTANGTSSYLSFGMAFALGVWSLVIPLMAVSLGYLLTLFRLKKA